MSSWGSIISSLAPEVGDVLGSLLEVAVENKKTNSNQNKSKITPAGENKKKSKPQNKKVTKKIEPEVSKQNDICEKDCICDDIKIKSLSDNRIKPVSIPINIKPDELAKYIVYSEILGKPACKKNRVY